MPNPTEIARVAGRLRDAGTRLILYGRRPSVAQFTIFVPGLRPLFAPRFKTHNSGRISTVGCVRRVVGAIADGHAWRGRATGKRSRDAAASPQKSWGALQRDTALIARLWVNIKGYMATIVAKRGTTFQQKITPPVA